MRKRYLHDSYGKDDQFWDLNWKGSMSNSGDGANLSVVLTEAFKTWFPQGASVLEGGCGDCGYLRFLAHNGYRVTGVDFAKQTVSAANKNWPTLDIREGNIMELAFPDSYFDAYYSGGVIEHFEAGFDAQLREAHRVLKSGGIFAVTVPHLNLMRRAHDLIQAKVRYKDLDGRESIFLTQVESCLVEPAPQQFHFHEYMLQTAEMYRLLSSHGFTIIDEHAFAIQWGLLDQTWFRQWMRPEKTHRNWLNKCAGALIRASSRIERSKTSFGKQVSRISGMVAGHLKLFVCRVDK